MFKTMAGLQAENGMPGCMTCWHQTVRGRKQNCTLLCTCFASIDIHAYTPLYFGCKRCVCSSANGTYGNCSKRYGCIRIICKRVSTNVPPRYLWHTCCCVDLIMRHKGRSTRAVPVGVQQGIRQHYVVVIGR